MQIIIWIIVGAVIGWIASRIMRTDIQNTKGGLWMNLVVGVVGSLIGVQVLAPMFGLRTVTGADFSAISIVASLAGAIILVAIVNFVRNGTRK
ncbi:MAG: GlsB/YeaQ/YmgE family stress response membrane protein [Comamonadaceae bacterium]|nr:MAG: GlsB/YeaQ/YmgE family stress response membrane protein [Comamonadaceae bacterium]